MSFEWEKGGGGAFSEELGHLVGSLVVLYS